MRLYIAAPPNLVNTAHLTQALKASAVEADELLLPSRSRGTTDLWMRDWASKNSCDIRTYESEEEVFRLLARSNGEGAIVAVVSPDHPQTLDLIARAESQRIPIFVYRELYRQDPRVNCRFSPVERPDVWLRGLTPEQRDFFRNLHELCRRFGVTLTSSSSAEGGSLMQFNDGTEFEGIELDGQSCRVRPRGSFRYRRIRLDP